MKHDIEGYKETLKTVFGNQKSIDRTKLIDLIAKARNTGHLEAEKVLNYCRAKGIVESKHYYSFYYKYSLNLGKEQL